MSTLCEREKTIALNAVVRDCETSVRAMLESVAPYVDEIVIVDNGSKDKTAAVCAEFGARVIDGSDLLDADGVITNFADARNRALDATRSAYVIWLDGDDVLIGGEKLRGLALSGFRDLTIGQLMVAYWYRTNARGEPVALQLRERIIRKRAGRWQSPVHEAWIADYAVGTQIVPHDILRSGHRHTGEYTPNLKRNLKILLGAYEREPSVTWIELYLGKTYLGLHDWRKAIEHLVAVYEKGPDAIQRFEAAHMAADAFFHLGLAHAAREFALKAFVMAPSDPRMLLQLARIAYHAQQFEPALEFARLCQQGKFSASHNTHDPTMPMTYGRVMEIAALHKLGRHDEALTRMDGLDRVLEPGNDYDEALGEVWRDAQIMRQAKELERAFVQESTQDPFSAAKAAAHLTAPAANLTGWGKLREASGEQHPKAVDLFCGDTPHPWTGTTMRAGHIGGSEVAAVRLAEGLSQFGWQVTVYNGRPDGTIVEDHGVRYAPAALWNTRDRRERVIYWRSPWALDYQLRARQKLLWFHDAASPDAWPPHRRANVDQVVTIARSQSDAMVKILGQERIVEIPNFVPRLPVAGIERRPHSAIWTSAPYRGLDIALDLWPRVRERVPDAVLRVVEPFGELWDMFIKGRPFIHLGHLGHAVDALWFEDMIRVKLQGIEGVQILPVLTQRAMAHELSASEIWLYTASWPEMCSCASIEAQLYGAVPVCPRYAGLSETVHAGFYLPHPVWENRDEAVEIIIDSLTNDPLRAQRRAAALDAMSAYDEDRILAKWDALLRSADRRADGIEATGNPASEEIIHADEDVLSNPRFAYIVTECRRRHAPKVLDLGTGDGWTALAAAIGGAGEVTTVDRMPTDFERIRPHLDGHMQRIKPIALDLEEAMPDGEYDVVIAEEIMEHLASPASFIARAKQKVQPGGILIVSVPYYSGRYGKLLDLDGHKWLFTSHDLRTLLGDRGEVTTDGNHLIGRWRRKR